MPGEGESGDAYNADIEGEVAAQAHEQEANGEIFLCFFCGPVDQDHRKIAKRIDQ